ncbi:MAG: hypothetical protein ACYDAC_06970 [Candidatus Dormibacteria bacterium]
MSMVDAVQRMLPGERVQAVCTAQTGVYPLLWWLPYGEFLTMLNGRRLVAVTDRSIVVMRAGRFLGSTRRPQAVLCAVPRTTPVGPFRKRWAHVDIGSERLWIHQRGYRFLEKALGTPSAATAPPPPAAPEATPPAAPPPPPAQP